MEDRKRLPCPSRGMVSYPLRRGLVPRGLDIEIYRRNKRFD
eukprot:SAG31_NODE_36783_length_310_cov_0.919431_1_plen_40_part_01